MIAQEVKDELTHHLIPFWSSMKDEKHGGFYGELTDSMELLKKSDKGCILNSRIIWFFSNAYLMLKDDTLLDLARHGYEFMMKHCNDLKYGGIYWSVKYDGTAKDTTKHTYNQAFSIYALVAFYEASGQLEAINFAMRLFELIESECRDEDGYLESFTRDFHPESNEKLSENGVIAERTMNTLLHVMEAYTQLYRITKNQRVKKKLIWIVNTIEKKIYNPNLCRLEVFFDKKYHSLIDLQSYGHDIEAAWLLDLTLDVLGDEKLTKRISKVTEALTEKIYRTAFDGKSLSNECEKGIVDEHRVWWVQAENLVGMLNGYERNPEKKEYLQAAMEQWSFIRDYVIDQRDGSEWFWEVSKEGIPYHSRSIVEAWKCPYHNGRMCIEVLNRIPNR